MSRSIVLPAAALCAAFLAAPIAAGESGHGAKAAPAAPHHPAAHAGAAHWGYEGAEGPDHWAEMDAGNTACAVGKVQSPINIEPGSSIKAQLRPLDFVYQPAAATVANNGHTIQVNVQAAGRLGAHAGSFSLAQFHFHTPSEELVAGRSYPLVAHFVHKSARSELAVVAVLFEVGAPNPEIERIFAAMPLEGGREVALPGGIDVSRLLPANRAYYAFEGSLTTPPCSEGVKWHVLKQPVTLSATQLARFQAIYPMNARPVQPGNGRLVLDSDTGTATAMAMKH